MLALLVAACASPAPSRRPPPEAPASYRVHVVRRGETLWRISQRYGTTVDALAQANALRDATQLDVGQRLLIPPRTRLAVQRSEQAWSGAHPRGRGTPQARLIWPVERRVSSAFGFRNGAHHDGIDIPAPPGTKIRAAEAGRVVHSGNALAGYGNMIIVKHSGNISTVYAHNRKNLVREGDFVEQGQVIAEVGSTGRTTAPHLHFEVRRDGRARDPLDYLP